VGVTDDFCNDSVLILDGMKHDVMSIRCIIL